VTVLSILLLLGVQDSIALFEGSQALSICPYNKSSVKMKMRMEHWWNTTDRGKSECVGRNLSWCDFVHDTSHVEQPDIEPGHPWLEAAA